MTTDRGSFILGAGAQKAGTSWLYAYMAAWPGCDMGHVKEHHVWDGLTLPEMAHFDLRTRMLPLQRRLRSWWMAARHGQPGRLFLRQAMQRDPERYFAYFDRRLAAPGVTLTGDLTPNYAGLDTETLIRIRNGFAARGIRARAVFLMRDPLSRALSAIRMYHRDGRGARRGEARFEGVDMTVPAPDALLPYLASREWHLLADYLAIVARLEAVFPPKDLYMGFYETMFTDAEFVRLNSFLGTAPDHAFQEQVFNSTSGADPLPDELRAQALTRLAPVYYDVFARWPGMRAHWADPARAGDSAGPPPGRLTKTTGAASTCS